MHHAIKTLRVGVEVQLQALASVTLQELQITVGQTLDQVRTL